MITTIAARTQVSEPPLRAIFESSVLSHVVCDGPGVLHSVLVGNAGCCRIRIHDDGRTLFPMPFAFAGSFFLEVAFNKRLMVDMIGEMAAHLQITYRRARVRHAA